MKRASKFYTLYTTHTTSHSNRAGFALPLILIASILLISVLVLSASATSSVVAVLRAQYYNQLAQDAAQSGLVKAQDCLRANSYIPLWSGTKKLYPNTDCVGATAGCDNADSCFLDKSGNYRTSFEVPPPADKNVSQVITIKGTVEILRRSNSSVFKTYSYDLVVNSSSLTKVANVAFGYNYGGANGDGVAFATVDTAGVMRTVGFNLLGMLGNGSSADSLVPTTFIMPPGDQVKKAYTSFSGAGTAFFAVNQDGVAYSAGRNGGQLGNGEAANSSSVGSIPKKVLLPAGDPVVDISILGKASYFTLASGNGYASGECASGQLGTGYAISGCSNVLTPQRISLPAVTADPNTQIKKIYADRSSAFAIMKGGMVYGWGGNLDWNQGYISGDNSIPRRLGQFGDSGNPQAINVITDGFSTYVTGSDGLVYSIGSNQYGQLGRPADTFSITSGTTQRCASNVGNTNFQLTTCADSPDQQFQYRQADSTVYNPGSNRCLDSTDGTNLIFSICSTATSQKFTLTNSPSDKSYIRSVSSSRCLFTSTPNITLRTCSLGNTSYSFALRSSEAKVMQIPSSDTGSVAQVAIDQQSVCVRTTGGSTSNNVWCAGMNHVGQLGNGGQTGYSGIMTKFILPAGVKPIDIAATSQFYVRTDISNILVVGSDGKVYGAGSNDFGQLGDGTTTRRLTPVAMNVIGTGTVKAKTIQSAVGTSVIYTTDGRIFTVGRNNYGQLGDGTTTPSLVPKANDYTNIVDTTVF